MCVGGGKRTGVCVYVCLSLSVCVLLPLQGSYIRVSLVCCQCPLLKPNLSLDADLNLAQTAWGDSGVYVCSVVSSQDLTGNSEDYTELIVLGEWLLSSQTLFRAPLTCCHLPPVHHHPSISTKSYTTALHRTAVL